MNNEEYISSLLNKAYAAQSVYANFNQEQVDQIVKAVGRIAFDYAEKMAIMAVEETGFGRVDSKTFKIQRSMAATWHYLKDKKSMGLIDVDEENALLTYAKPAGVAACICPSTNPSSTVFQNGMSILKGKNAMIVAPHPKAFQSTKIAVDLIRQVLREHNAPEDIVQMIESPSYELVQLLMKKVDVVAATGGPGMVAAAYSSGTPSYGVGAGNMQVIMVEDYNEFDKAATFISNNRFYDNAITCTSEQFVFIPEKNQKAMLDAFKTAGAFLVEDEEVKDKIRQLLFKEDGNLNPASVGMPAITLAAEIGLDVPEDTKFLLLKAKGVGKTDVLCREKLCPVTAYVTYNDFDEAIAGAVANLELIGKGHSAVIYTYNDELVRKAGEALPVCRLLVNQAGSASSGGGLMNGLNPTISLGCGFWGRNSISENLIYKHFLNITQVAYVKKGATPPDYLALWND